MKKGKITISDNGYVSVDQKILMSQSEIVNLFEVFTSKVNSNIRIILKSAVATADYKHGATQMNNTILPDYYNLEMIVALAFRINSPKAKIFRDWIMKKSFQKMTHQMPIIIKYGDNLFLS